MKIAVMGDIHSNHIAFETCIKHALDRNVDEFIFLGDYISDCPYPQKTMQIIYDMQRNYKCSFIRGNREDYMLNHRKNPEEKWTYSSASGSLLYTYENLSKEDLDFYENMDIQGIYQNDRFPVFRYCHGSLNSSTERLIPENENMKSVIENLDVDVLICGHTHIQGTGIYGNKRIINPGSVGVPMYHNGKSQYMILHGTDKGWEEEFFQLKYDVDAVKKEYESSGLDKKAPYWIKLTVHVLETGDDYTYPCLALAKKLCEEAEGSANWPDIPDKYWAMAAKTFGIE